MIVDTLSLTFNHMVNVYPVNMHVLASSFFYLARLHMYKRSKTWYYCSNVVVTKKSKNITESDHCEIFIFYHADIYD